MTDRRAALAAVIASLLSHGRSLGAQSPAKIPIVGFPMVFIPGDDPLINAFRQGLRTYGWVDGESIRVEHRFGEGDMSELPSLIRDLIQIKPDVYIAAGRVIVEELKRAGVTVPMVMVAIDYDPVSVGFVNSLNRPGGNITGLYGQILDISQKVLELLRDFLPKLRSVGVVYDEIGINQLAAFKSAAEILRLKLVPIEVRAPFNFDAAFAKARRSGVQALAVSSSGRFQAYRFEISRAALKYSLPTGSAHRAFATDGQLFAYGADVKAMFERASYFVDRILRGASPAELPVEQPNLYRLTLNLKTAKALGLFVPEAIWVRVDESIK